MRILLEVFVMAKPIVVSATLAIERNTITYVADHIIKMNFMIDIRLL